MRRLLRLPLSCQVLLAAALGAAVGVWLNGCNEPNPLVYLCREVFAVARVITLAWTRALAVPLIVSSLVLGAVGLEPMRGVGQLVVKTVAWMVGSTLLAVAVGFGAGRFLGLEVQESAGLHGAIVGWTERWHGLGDWQWGWLGLVLLGLAFGYHRNQIEEGHGRVLLRICHGLDQILGPLLRWMQAVAPVGVFFLVASETSVYGWYTRWCAVQGLGSCAVGVSVAGAIYCAVLALVVWQGFRVPPWNYFGSLLPAMFVAAAGQSVPAALPLTTDAVRRRVGVSNRVAGPVLSLGAVLHRDGAILGWTTVFVCAIRSSAGDNTWDEWATIGVIAFVAGCGREALTEKSGVLPAILFGFAGSSGDAAVFAVLLERLIASVGGAVSVFSQACGAAVIARSEGEYWVPGPTPDVAEIHALKASLEAAAEP